VSHNSDEKKGSAGKGGPRGDNAESVFVTGESRRGHYAVGGSRTIGV